MTPAAPARREVQFVVERACPGHSAAQKTLLEKHVPFAVWVYWPSSSTHPKASANCTETQWYMLTPDGMCDAKQALGMTLDWTHALICEHMGRVIE